MIHKEDTEEKPSEMFLAYVKNLCKKDIEAPESLYNLLREIPEDEGEWLVFMYERLSSLEWAFKDGIYKDFTWQRIFFNRCKIFCEALEECINEVGFDKVKTMASGLKKPYFFELLNSNKDIKKNSDYFVYKLILKIVNFSAVDRLNSDTFFASDFSMLEYIEEVEKKLDKACS